MNKTRGKTKPATNTTKQKIQLVVLGLLVLIALVIGGTQLQQSKAMPNLHAVVMTSTAQPAVINQVHDMPVSFVVQLIGRPVDWPVTIQRDPFSWSRLNTPAAVVEQAGPDRQAIHDLARSQLKLQGVMFFKNPRVLMNGLVLEQGAQVSGFVIKQIEKRAVTVTREGVDVRITL